MLYVHIFLFFCLPSLLIQIKSPQRYLGKYYRPMMMTVGHCGLLTTVANKHPFTSASNKWGGNSICPAFIQKLFCSMFLLTSAIKQNQRGGTHRPVAGWQWILPPFTAGTDQSSTMEELQTIDHKYVCYLGELVPGGHLFRYVFQHNSW